MRSKLRAVFANHAALGKAEDLESAAVREDRTRPPDEPVKTAEAGVKGIARTQIEVIGAAEDDRRADVDQVLMAQPLDSALRSDRHERRRVDDAVGRLD